VSDARVKKLAETLVRHSIQAEKDEVVLIRSDEAGKPLALEVFRQVLAAGAHPHLSVQFEEADEIFMRHAARHQIQNTPRLRLLEARNIDALVAIHAPLNLKGLSRTSPERQVERARVLKPIQERIMTKVRWVIVNFPTQALAQEAEMSLEEYQDFLYRACNQDWKAESQKMTRLARQLEKGDRVRLVGKETDIGFRIRGRKFVVAAGENNVPDGEVFTTPWESSVEGRIYFDFPALHAGREVRGVRLWFEKGRVVKATAEKSEKYLHAMIGTDTGARRVGEFGIGLNKRITRFSKDILFDEKIGGTIHLALGRAYPETGGINKSAIHWDLIKDLRRRGEFYLDGRLIQKNGKFLIT
jgi:aminopeptidase